MFTLCPVKDTMECMENIIQIKNLTKVYDDGFQALADVSLDIRRGEIFALLGPNGAGKTTLIGIVCGIINASGGTVTVDGHDHIVDYRKARGVIGLVPQEIYLDPFLTVIETLSIARGLYGKKYDPTLLKETLTELSLWDKKDNKVQELSGGMKRRVLIGKALMNEPAVLFLDEPTAGVDVELRHGMWDLVEKLKSRGTTIILTTHYIEEAQDMADRIGIIQDGDIKLVEEKEALIQKLGSKKLKITLNQKIANLPAALIRDDLTLSTDGMMLTYSYKADGKTGITEILTAIKDAGLQLTDISTEETSLEEIFVSLTHEKANSQDPSPQSSPQGEEAH